MKKLFIFIVMFSSYLSQASELFETSDRKIILEKINEAIEYQKNQTASDRAEFYYEEKVDDSVCSHCPEYLKLIKEVNKIVDEIPAPKGIASSNHQLIQIDRLRFMYYETVSAMSGNEVCSIFSDKEPRSLRGIDRQDLTLLAEQLIELPNVTSFQYYPNPPAKEVRYLYRGEGLQSHIIIEVIVNADKSAVIKYHYYDPYNLPDIGRGDTAPQRKLNEFEGSSSIASNVGLDAKAVLNVTDQSAKASLRSETNEWVKIEARHVKDSGATIKTILPLEISVPGETGMKVLGGVSHEYKEDFNKDTQDKIDRAELTFGNDKNTELLKAQMEKKEGKTEVIVGSKYEMNIVDSLKFQGEVENKEIELTNGNKRHQKVGLTFSNEKGDHEYIKADIKKIDEIETIHLSTKHQWEVNSEKGLIVRAEASQETVEEKIQDKVRSHEMVMSLTDHNHEYVTARVVQGDELDRLIALSSKYTVGDYGKINTTIERYDSGKESISLGHEMRAGKNSIQTNMGHDSESGQFINFKAERKISKTATMILTLQTDSNHQTTVMYQFESKF